MRERRVGWKSEKKEENKIEMRERRVGGERGKKEKKEKMQLRTQYSIFLKSYSHQEEEKVINWLIEKLKKK